MATYSSAIKVAGVVNVGGSSSSTGYPTSYTVPANSYVVITAGISGSFTVDGYNLSSYINIYVGPGSVIACAGANYAKGVLFTNGP